MDARLAVGHVPLPLPVYLTVTRGSAAVFAATAIPVPDTAGYLYTAVLARWQDQMPRAGDTVWARQGTQTVSMTISNLSAVLLARQDILSGTAAAGEHLTAYLYPFDAPASWYTATAMADASGAYTLTWTAHPDVRPRDGGYLFRVTGNTSLSRRFVAPFLRVQAGGYAIGGVTLPDSDVRVALPYGFEDYAYADGGGLFSTDTSAYRPKTAVFSFGAGAPVTATAAGTVVTTTVHTITARVDAAYGVVSGQADPGAQVTVLRFAGLLPRDVNVWPGAPLEQRTVTADASGQYSVSLALAPADYGLALVENGDGHQSFDWFAAPSAQFTLGWHGDARLTLASGQVDGRSPLSVNITGPSGYPKAAYTLEPATHGYFPSFWTISWEWGAGNPEAISLALESGDRVTITQAGRGAVLTAEMPILTLDVDEGAAAIFGQAPAGALLTLSARDWEGNLASRVVTASLTGTYRLPLSALGVSNSWYAWSVQWQSPAGYTVLRSLNSNTYPGACPPVSGRLNVGGNTIFWDRPILCNGPLAVRLYDSSANLKAEVGTSAYAGMAQFFAPEKSKRPIPILGGDRLVFEYDGQTTTWDVPPLSVHLDESAAQVTGTGIAGVPLFLWVSSGGVAQNLVLTPTAAGTFTLPLSAAPAAGARAQAYVSIGGVDFLATDALPAWQIYLSGRTAGGVLPPLTSYTLTYRGVGTLASGYANSDGGWQTSAFDEVPLSPGDLLTLTLPSRSLTLTVPRLSALLDASTAEVQGQAPPNADVQVMLAYVTPYGATTWSAQTVSADASGVYRAVFPALAGTRDLHGTLTYRPSESAIVSLDFYPPHWEITLGSNRLYGVAPVAGSGATQFAWHSAAGETYTTTVHPSAFNGTFWVSLPSALQADDVLVVTDTQGTVFAYTVPPVTAEHDYARQVLHGEAPAGAVVETVFPGGYGSQSVFRQVRADFAGQYGMDTSDLHLTPLHSAYVVAVDAQGNRVHVDFVITGYRAWLPLIAR
ncbi:MAG: hypothetical protein Fur0018_25100 [Anaerolineales bacterium]